MTGLAVQGATLIDGTGASPLENGTIVIDRDGRITGIGRDAEVRIPAGTEVLDGRGRYVVPGLMDANVHLVATRTPDTLLEFEGRYEELALEAAQLLLKYGITTAFDTWGPAGPLTVVRDAINAGERLGARILCAGNIIGLGGPLSDDFFSVRDVIEDATVKRINSVWEHGTGPELSNMTAEQVGERTAEYLESTGVDFIKWSATDHRSNASGTFYMFTDRQQRAIAETARRCGKTFQAHTTTVESLHLEVELGADVLQHGDLTLDQPIPDELLDRIAERRMPTAALVVTDRHLAWSAKTPAASAMHRMRIWADINQRQLIARGARLLLTTDGFAYGPRVSEHPGFRAGTLSPETPDLPVQLGYSHLHWMQGAVERGMNTMEVLRSATSHIADAYGVSDIVGTLEAGKLGDLLILGSDPLRNVSAYGDIVHVIKQGRCVDRDELAKDLLLATDLVAAGHP